MAQPETPLNPRAMRDVLIAMAGVDQFPPKRTSADVLMDIERERIYRALADKSMRQRMDSREKASFTDVLKCLLLPITAATLTLMAIHKVRQGFKSN